MPRIHRRDLIIGGAIAGLAVGCGESSEAPPGDSPPRRVIPPDPAGPPINAPSTQEPPKTEADLPTRVFGKTGERVTILGLGAVWDPAALPSREIGVGVVERAFEKGIRYFDTAAVYPDSEDRYGEGLAGKRDKVFLTTKSYLRDRDGALGDLDRSLQRLRTDHLDAWLHHDVRTMADVDAIVGPNGALEAMIQAKEEKKVRYIGFSGHTDPVVLAALLDAYPYDVCLLGMNAAESFEKPFIPTILQKAVSKSLGVVGMKAFGYGKLLGAVTPKEALSYALSLPVATVIVGMKSLQEVDDNVPIARAATVLSPTEMTAIETKAAKVAFDATFFRRGTWS